MNFILRARMFNWLRSLWLDGGTQLTLIGEVVVFLLKVIWSCVIVVFWLIVYAFNVVVCLILSVIALIGRCVVEVMLKDKPKITLCGSIFWYVERNCWTGELTEWAPCLPDNPSGKGWEYKGAEA